MKKNFILSMAIAYTMLAACSNDEIVDVNTGGTISFRTLIDIATRTNQETTASLSQKVAVSGTLRKLTIGRTMH